jgi:hypothetical protein
MDQWMMDRLAGAIPNPSAAVVKVASLVAVLKVEPSPDPAVGTFSWRFCSWGRSWSPA